MGAGLDRLDRRIGGAVEAAHGLGQPLVDGLTAGLQVGSAEPADAGVPELHLLLVDGHGRTVATGGGWCRGLVQGVRDGRRAPSSTSGGGGGVSSTHGGGGGPPPPAAAPGGGGGGGFGT